jgi:hypothetical protein
MPEGAAESRTHLPGRKGVRWDEGLPSCDVLNLDPNDADGGTDVADFRFLSIAAQIGNTLGTPDVITLQEVQDNSGSEDDGTISASETLDLLARSIDFIDNFALDGSLDYDWTDNSFITGNASGGQPGGNIRTACLANPPNMLPEDEHPRENINCNWGPIKRYFT